MVPRSEIEEEGYDLCSRYKEDVFEEVAYEAPEVILDGLLKAELGEAFFYHEKHGKHGIEPRKGAMLVYRSEDGSDQAGCAVAGRNRLADPGAHGGTVPG